MPDTDHRMITPPFVMVTLSTFAYFLTLGSLLPTLPRFIEHELHAGSVAVGVGVGTFAIAAAVLRPFAGRLGDIRNRRLLVVGGSALVGTSVIAYSLVGGLASLIALRFVTGVGEAAMWVGAATAIQDMAPENRRGEAASYFSVALYAGLAFGPLAGEWLVRHHGYDSLFVAAGASALVASVLGLWTPATTPHDPQPFRLFHPAAIGPGAILLLGLLPFVGFSTYVSLYGPDVGVEDVAPLLLTYGVLVLIIRVVGARLPDRLGWRRASTMALVVLGGAGLVLSLWGAAPGLWVATVGLALGMSLLFPALLSAAVANVAPNERGQAVGTFSVAFDLANGLGPVLLGGVVSLGSYRGAFAVAGIAALAGLGLVWRMAGTGRA
ncbi:MAG: MFS transporter [Acidimicrobiales bacterium]